MKQQKPTDLVIIQVTRKTRDAIERAFLKVPRGERLNARPQLTRPRFIERKLIEALRGHLPQSGH